MSLAVDWQQETRRYDRPHPRLKQMADALAACPQRRLLDVGCSTATLRRLLPADFDYYGCDVADHAARILPDGHFVRQDLNRYGDLSCFRRRGIDCVHIGGVVEYLERPGELLRELQRLVPSGAPLVCSIINFQSTRYADAAKHHPGWIFRPTLEEFRALLRDSGWNIVRETAFLGRSGLRGWWFRRWTDFCGIDHPRTRAAAEQFILQATATGPGETRNAKR